jgi:hypothetical protein
MDDDVNKSLEEVNLEQVEPIKPLLPLLKVFSHVEENHLHIIVRAPSDGKLIEDVFYGTDNLTDVVQRVLLSEMEEKRRGEIGLVACTRVRPFLSFPLTMADT